VICLVLDYFHSSAVWRRASHSRSGRSFSRKCIPAGGIAFRVAVLHAVEVPMVDSMVIVIPISTDLRRFRRRNCGGYRSLIDCLSDQIILLQPSQSTLKPSDLQRQDLWSSRYRRSLLSYIVSNTGVENHTVHLREFMPTPRSYSTTITLTLLLRQLLHAFDLPATPTISHRCESKTEYKFGLNLSASPPKGR
jgi:hypothetical protein